jgi:hypothetical protein
MKAKYKESETILVWRSQIKFAPYNPRVRSEKVITSLKKNIKKVGFLGGVVWNEKTGNLVSGHKRIETLDVVNGYDGKNDYQVKIEKVALDEKTEKEQNVYMNNPSAQGEFDYEKLAKLLPDIDAMEAELTEAQIDKLKVFAPADIVPEFRPEPEKKQATPEQIQELKDLKKEIREGSFDRHDELQNLSLTIVFDSWEDKVNFCETYGIGIDSKFIKYGEFSEKTTL